MTALIGCCRYCIKPLLRPLDSFFFYLSFYSFIIDFCEKTLQSPPNSSYVCENRAVLIAKSTLLIAEDKALSITEICKSSKKYVPENNEIFWLSTIYGICSKSAENNILLLPTSPINRPLLLTSISHAVYTE